MREESKVAVVAHPIAVLLPHLLLAQASPAAPVEAQQEQQPAQTAPSTSTVEALASHLKVEGGVDTYYAFNFNRPVDKANFFPGTGTSAKRAQEFGLNLASIGVSLAPEPVGFKALLGVGSSLAVLHAGEPLGIAVGPEVWYPLQQASVSWVPTEALTLEAGVFPSHIGFEVLQSQANWTYTRAWMGDLSPYYQTGLKAAYAFSDNWSAQLHLINGWQVIGDNNSNPALGAQVAYTSDALYVSLNGFAGEEPVGDVQGLRLFGDVVATVKVTEQLQLAATVDAAVQERPGQAQATWWAAGLNARYQVMQPFAVAARAEVFDDRDGAISGTAQRLAGGTVTLELRPMDPLVFKLEGRHDVSTADVFSTSTLAADGTPVRTTSQTLLLAGTTVYF